MPGCRYPFSPPQWRRARAWRAPGLCLARERRRPRPGHARRPPGALLSCDVVFRPGHQVSSCLGVSAVREFVSLPLRCAPFRDVPDNAFTRSARISLSAQDAAVFCPYPVDAVGVAEGEDLPRGPASRSLCARPPRSQRGAGPARRRFCGAGGTTFPARARAAGITTSAPSEVRTAKEAESFSSRMPRTSAICSPSPGLGRRQRITTRWPTSAGVRRTSSR